MTATPQMYHAAFTSAWQEIQRRIDALMPMEQSMARAALKADLVQAVVNKGVDAALAAAPAPEKTLACQVGTQAHLVTSPAPEEAEAEADHA